ncbi:MAG: hypothetical protein QNI86_00870 [Halieaceae bacterium]|nr:hypothetical protein [Halieaceae bacterium]
MRWLLLLLMGLGSFPSFAECMRDTGRIETICGAGPCLRDRYGEVYCAPHIDGSALLDRYQQVVCSVGECRRSIDDEILCSSQPGGAVLTNIHGEIDCYGGCRPASADACERNFAGPLDEDGNLVTPPGQPPTGLNGYRPPGRPSR